MNKNECKKSMELLGSMRYMKQLIIHVIGISQKAKLKRAGM
jgi:hypothetical protein